MRIHTASLVLATTLALGCADSYELDVSNASVASTSFLARFNAAKTDANGSRQSTATDGVISEWMDLAQLQREQDGSFAAATTLPFDARRSIHLHFTEAVEYRDLALPDGLFVFESREENRPYLTSAIANHMTLMEPDVAYHDDCGPLESAMRLQLTAAPGFADRVAAGGQNLETVDYSERPPFTSEAWEFVDETFTAYPTDDLDAATGVLISQTFATTCGGEAWDFSSSVAAALHRSEGSN